MTANIYRSFQKIDKKKQHTALFLVNINHTVVLTTDILTLNYFCGEGGEATLQKSSTSNKKIMAMMTVKGALQS